MNVGLRQMELGKRKGHKYPFITPATNPVPAYDAEITGGKRSLLQGGSQYLRLCPQPLGWSPLVPLTTVFSSACSPVRITQELDNDQILCSALVFCAVQPFGCGYRSGERQAVNQFPPSESHSDPRRGNWRLTPARQWRPHGQTKSLALGNLDTRDPNQQITKNVCKIWAIPVIRQDMFSRYCVQDAEGVMSGFVAVLLTMGKDCDCWTDLAVWSLYTNLYFRNS